MARRQYIYHVSGILLLMTFPFSYGDSFTIKSFSPQKGHVLLDNSTLAFGVVGDFYFTVAVTFSDTIGLLRPDQTITKISNISHSELQLYFDTFDLIDLNFLEGIYYTTTLIYSLKITTVNKLYDTIQISYTWPLNARLHSHTHTRNTHITALHCTNDEMTDSL